MKILIIYNPHAGKQNGHTHASRLKKAITKKQPDTLITVYKSESISAMIQFFNTIENDFDTIVIIGGDGTLGPTIDAMIKNNVDIPLYCYGRGTANDYASFLKTNKSPRRSAKIILTNKQLMSDTLLVNNKNHAINVACGGAFTNGVTRYNKKSKRLLGKLAYIIKAALTSFNMQSQTLRFVTDDTNFECEVFLFYILNSKNVGGLKNSCPVSSISDGQLDLVCIKKCGFFGKLSIALSQLRGRLHLNKNVKHIKGQTFEVHHTDENIKPNFTLTDIDGNASDPYPMYVTVGKKIPVIIGSNGK